MVPQVPKRPKRHRNWPKRHSFPEKKMTVRFFVDICGQKSGENQLGLKKTPQLFLLHDEYVHHINWCIRFCPHDTQSLRLAAPRNCRHTQGLTDVNDGILTTSKVSHVRISWGFLATNPKLQSTWNDLIWMKNFRQKKGLKTTSFRLQVVDFVIFCLKAPYIFGKCNNQLDFRHVVELVTCAVNDSVGQNRLTSRLGLSDHTIDLVLRIDQNLPKVGGPRTDAIVILMNKWGWNKLWGGPENKMALPNKWGFGFTGVKFPP